MSKDNEARDVRAPREEGVLGGTLPDNKQQAETQALTVGRVHRREEVDLSALVIPPTHRAIDPNKVDELAQSMNEIGLLHPIVVYYDETDASIVELVAGGHRVHAAQSLGWDFMDALWIHDKDEARLITITENLHRAELTVMERSEQIAEWVRLTKDRQIKLAQVAPVSKGGRGNKGGVRQAARDLGLTRDEVRRAEKIDAIVPAAKEAAKQAGIADNQKKLMEVATADPEEQVDVAKAIDQKSDKPARNLKEERAQKYKEARRLGIELAEQNPDLAKKISRLLYGDERLLGFAMAETIRAALGLEGGNTEPTNIETETGAFLELLGPASLLRSAPARPGS